MQGALVVGLLAFMVSCTGRGDGEAREALDFLYASMPLPDSVDYPRAFWEANVDVALRARREMPWGAKVPGREWRHFVLPLRVNNEDLDSFRIAYYEELRQRVKDKTMYAAVLEVNHWCHEHVSYQPSDSRTSSPMNTVRSAIGRCGEESTLTVSALRTVGIPARQVYTPRWAHTDDNHAWVEAWVDGKWYFLGACEPEPVLNLGWFNAAAARGMLMHTKVFGDYGGPEEVVGKTACYTEINVTENYTDAAAVKVTVLGADSLPVEGASVDFRLYNYAELYPLVTKQTDPKGQTSLTCGRGDIVVWASKDGRFGFCKVSVGKDALVTVVLDKDASSTASLDVDLMPPPMRENRPKVSPESLRENRIRLAREDSIRLAYTRQAFCPDASPGSPEEAARANWRTIRAFRQGPDADCSLALLRTLSQKDLRDVTADVLADAAQNTVRQQNALWEDYVLCPRVSNERLTPCRSTLRKHFSGMTLRQLLQWVEDSISVDDTRNPQHLCMSPLGVLRHRTCDAHSRDIFFVAAARAIGIPARINAVTGKVEAVEQKADDTELKDANDLPSDSQFFRPQPLASSPLPPAPRPLFPAPRPSLSFTYSDLAVKEDPCYYTHFTLSRIEDGRPQLQEFPEGTTWRGTFADGVQADAGQYLLVSGTRLANGGVLAHLEMFCLAPAVTPAEAAGGAAAESLSRPASKKEVTEVPLHLRTTEHQLRVIGSFDSEQEFTTVRGRHTSLLEAVGRGFYVVGLIRSGHEPSMHLLHDMEASNIYLSRWDRCYLMLFPTREDYEHFDRKEFDELPDNVLFGIADPATAEAMHIRELTHGNDELPILMLADTFNRVVWFRQGYSIGLADQLMDALRQLILGE